MIEVRHLIKDYGPLRALDGVTFSIASGDVVGFLGPNGAGKTTCMKILTGFISATSGSVLIDGLDNVEYGPDVRARMGYLPENAPVYGEMTVGEYLTFIARVRRISSGSVARRVREVAELTGLEQRLKQETGTLSRGFRQRTGLAAALIHNPDILVLDEPTTGLDPNQIVEIRNLIRELGRERTVILSTHNLAEVTAVCNRIVIIFQGRIVADGTHEQIRAEHGGDRSCLVSFAAGPGTPGVESIAAGLSLIPGCSGVRTVTAEGGAEVTFRLGLATGNEGRLAVSRMAADRGWPLVELRSEQLDLETIFDRLTRQVDKAGAV